MDIIGLDSGLASKPGWSWRWFSLDLGVDRYRLACVWSSQTGWPASLGMPEPVNSVKEPVKISQKFEIGVLSKLKAELTWGVSNMIVGSLDAHLLERCIAMLGQLHDLEQKMTGGSGLRQDDLPVLPDFTVPFSRLLEVGREAC